MDFSPETLRARFHELSAERKLIDAELDPLRAELNAIVAGEADMTLGEARERERVVRVKIIELQQKLYPIEMERGACARALGGKTGVPA